MKKRYLWLLFLLALFFAIIVATRSPEKADMDEPPGCKHYTYRGYLLLLTGESATVSSMGKEIRFTIDESSHIDTTVCVGDFVAVESEHPPGVDEPYPVMYLIPADLA